MKQKKEGLDALAKHRFEPLAPKANILTLQNVYEEWSKTAFKEISHQLEANHKASWNYIKRYAKIPFNDLRTKHFQNVIDECKAANKSESTCKKIRTLISQLYKYAIANDICKTNYAKYIKIGKFEKKEKKIFSDLEINSCLHWGEFMSILYITGGIIFGLAVITNPGSAIGYAVSVVKVRGLSFIVVKLTQSINKKYSEIIDYAGWCLAGSGLVGIVRLAMSGVGKVGQIFQGIADFFDKITFWS